MSLRDVVLEIAQEMEHYAVEVVKGYRGDDTIILDFVKQLRRAVKASEGSSSNSSGMSPLSPDVIHAVKVQEEKEALRKVRQQGHTYIEKTSVDPIPKSVHVNPNGLLAAEDQSEFNMLELVGGHAAESIEPVFMYVSQTPPLGARMVSAGEVFIMRLDGRLHFDESSTEKFRDGRQ